MKPVSPFGLPIGFSVTFWAIIGFLRYFTERTPKIIKSKKFKSKYSFKLSEMAVLLPAHNEELVIKSSILALKKLVNKRQIYVVSDGSRDKTYQKAKAEGCHVSKLLPGRGKARALVYLINKYNLYERYKFIFIVDADTRIDETCLDKMTPLFDDPDVSVVFASSRIKWPKHVIPRLSLYFVAYRERLNRMLQYFLIYGQTWKFTNVNYVIPGFATIYRSSVLKQLQIDTPGILVEDFNLAFQLHKKNMGTIGYNPSAIAWDQYPDNLKDYWRQVKRWNIGFFQTIRKNGVWPSFFWLFLGIFSAEVILHSMFLVVLPIIILARVPFLQSSLGDFVQYYSGTIPFFSTRLENVFIGVFLIDYILTVIIGLINKKPQFIFYGLFFFFMHIITSLILLTSILPGLLESSSGKWVPPTRQKV